MYHSVNITKSPFHMFLLYIKYSLKCKYLIIIYCLIGLSILSDKVTYCWTYFSVFWVGCLQHPRWSWTNQYEFNKWTLRFVHIATSTWKKRFHATGFEPRAHVSETGVLAPWPWDLASDLMLLGRLHRPWVWF